MQILRRCPRLQARPAELHGRSAPNCRPQSSSRRRLGPCCSTKPSVAAERPGHIVQIPCIAHSGPDFRVLEQTGSSPTSTHLERKLSVTTRHECNSSFSSTVMPPRLAHEAQESLAVCPLVGCDRAGIWIFHSSQSQSQIIPVMSQDAGLHPPTARETGQGRWRDAHHPSPDRQITKMQPPRCCKDGCHAWSASRTAMRSAPNSNAQMVRVVCTTRFRRPQSAEWASNRAPPKTEATSNSPTKYSSSHNLTSFVRTRGMATTLLHGHHSRGSILSTLPILRTQDPTSSRKLGNKVHIIMYNGGTIHDNNADHIFQISLSFPANPCLSR